jgi:membrane associated rhomboid family serine protease
MTPTPVGMRCPECANQKTKVVRGVPTGVDLGRYPATIALVVINVVVFLAEVGSGSGGVGDIHSTLITKYGLFGPSVADGEWYRLLTSAFLHASFLHILGNMLLLFFLGRILEPGIGTLRFTLIYFVSLFAGSLGGLIATPESLSIGASGAVFGILAATFVIARGRGVDALASSVGILILLNLAFSFGVPGISVGAHLGGLVAGAVCAGLIIAGERGMLGPRHRAAELVAMSVLGVASVALSIAIA